MDDTNEGRAKQAGGKAKEWAGKATGDEEMEAEGRVDHAEGKGQEQAGKLKATARKVKEKITGKK